MIIQDVGDGVANRSHDVLDRATGMISVRAVAAFLVGSFADTADGSQWSVKDSDDLSQGNLVRWFDQAVAALDASPAGEETGPLECQEDLLKKFDRDVLTCRNVLSLQGCHAVRHGEFEERAKSIFTFL